jgi:hypothetical protein
MPNEENIQEEKSSVSELTDANETISQVVNSEQPSISNVEYLTSNTKSQTENMKVYHESLHNIAYIFS